MQKLARAVIGTNNVDNCSRYCQTPATKGLSRTVGYGGDSGSISDIENADLVIIIGSNTAESHPVLATRVKRSHKHRGQRLIVSDLRKHEMAERADIFIHPNPSTDAVWLYAVTKHLIDTGRHNQAFIDKWVNNCDEYQQIPRALHARIRRAHHRHPRPPRSSRSPTRSPQAERVCILWAMGVTQHCGGSDTSTSICNMLLAHRQLQAPRHRRLSSARPQQRAGLQRLRLHARRLLRLSEGRQRRHPRKVRSRLGRHAPHHHRPRQPP